MSKTIPAAELPKEIAELAAKVFETTDKPDRATTCIYYMVNIQHPVIAMLKHRFCQRYGIDPNHPMSDIQRTAFELMLFRGDVLKMIEDDFKQRSESDAP